MGKIKIIGELDLKREQDRRIYEPSGLAPTLRAENHDVKILVKKYRIRKLTPRECWRLMAFSDEDFDKAEKVVSNTQLYKQAGNSICVCVLMAIFSQMNIKGVKPWNKRN